MANGSPETRLGKNRVSTARNPVGKKPGFDRQKPGWGKTGFRPPETRLAKNRVSTVGEKTGFRRLGKNRVSSGWEKNRVSTVGKKPGFSGARNPVGKKPGFDSWVKNRVSSIGLFAQQKPGFFKKPGFLDVSACKS
jgi:hypothetical protein